MTLWHLFTVLSTFPSGCEQSVNEKLAREEEELANRALMNGAYNRRKAQTG